METRAAAPYSRPLTRIFKGTCIAVFPGRKPVLSSAPSAARKAYSPQDSEEPKRLRGPTGLDGFRVPNKSREEKNNRISSGQRSVHTRETCRTSACCMSGRRPCRRTLTPSRLASSTCESRSSWPRSQCHRMGPAPTRSRSLSWCGPCCPEWSSMSPGSHCGQSAPQSWRITAIGSMDSMGGSWSCCEVVKLQASLTGFIGSTFYSGRSSHEASAASELHSASPPRRLLAARSCRSQTTANSPQRVC